MRWGFILVGILARPWARQAVGGALAAITVALFVINLRRSGERVGRQAVRLDQLERSNDIQREMMEAAARRPRGRDNLVERLRGGKL